MRARRVSDQEQLTSRRGLEITHCSAPIGGRVTPTRHTGEAKKKRKRRRQQQQRDRLAAAAGPITRRDERVTGWLVEAAAPTVEWAGRVSYKGFTPRRTSLGHEGWHVFTSVVRYAAGGKAAGSGAVRFPPQKHQGGLRKGGGLMSERPFGGRGVSGCQTASHA